MYSVRFQLWYSLNGFDSSSNYQAFGDRSEYTCLNWYYYQSKFFFFFFFFFLTLASFKDSLSAFFYFRFMACGDSKVYYMASYYLLRFFLISFYQLFSSEVFESENLPRFLRIFLVFQLIVTVLWPEGTRFITDFLFLQSFL